MWSLMETASPSTYIGVVAFLTVLDVLAVILRFYTRRVLRQKTKPDDWFACLALIFVVASAIYLIYGVAIKAVGYKGPEGATVNAMVIENSKIEFFTTVLFFPAIWLIKMSFLLFYRRIFVLDSRDFKSTTNIVIIGMMAVITAWAIAFFFAYVFMCKPVSVFWNDPYNFEACFETWKMYKGFSISDLLSDCLIILIPVPLVWSLGFTTTRRLAILAVFFLGALAVAASAMRLARALWAGQLPNNTPLDGNLIASTIIFWQMIEMNLGLLAVCLPQLRGLIKTLKDRPVNSWEWYSSFRSKISSRWSSFEEANELPMSGRTTSRARTASEQNWSDTDDHITYLESVSSTAPSIKSDNIHTIRSSRSIPALTHFRT